MIETSEPLSATTMLKQTQPTTTTTTTSSKICKSHSVDSMCKQDQEQVSTTTTPKYETQKSAIVTIRNNKSNTSNGIIIQSEATTAPTSTTTATTNGRFTNFRPAGLRKKVADSKYQSSFITRSSIGGGVQSSTNNSKPLVVTERVNKLNKLKKQTAHSSYDLKSLVSSTPTSTSISMAAAAADRKSSASATIGNDESRRSGDPRVAERAPPLSLMQKLLLDEQKIYSDPSDNHKRRTVVLVRPKSSNGV